MTLFHRFIRFIVRTIFKWRYSLTVSGVDHPYKGGAILAPNHLSHLDPPAVGVAWPEAVHFLGRDTLFEKRSFGWLIRHLNCHPIARGSGDLSAIRMILRLLDEGKKVVVFPEGTRSRTGELGEGQPGVAMMALRAGVPVIPVRITGTDQILPPGAKKLAKRGKITVEFGEPIEPAEFAHLGRREAQTALTDAIMNGLRPR